MPKKAKLKKKKPLKAKSKLKTSAKKPLASKKKSKKTAKKTTSKRKAKVTFIPKGYNSISPYLIVADAAQAIEFYKKIFGAKEVMRMERGMDKVAHAELRIGDTKIMIADEFPQMNVLGPQAYGGSAVMVHLYIKNVDAVVEKALAAGAILMRPVETMFYGDRSGMIEDPFGHKWSVSTHVENVSIAQMRKRAQKLFSQNH